MPKSFDPYRNWFGIDDPGHTLTHYQLLGVREFETDPEVIREAGENRTQFLQDVSTGEHINEAQKLLNEVAKAMVCLTNPQKKSIYDQQLKEEENAVGKTRHATQTPGENASQNEIPVAKISEDSAATPARRPQPDPPSKPKPTRKPTRTTPLKKHVKRKPKSNFAPLVATLVPLLILVVVGGFWIVKSISSNQNGNGSGTQRSATTSSGKSLTENFTSWQPGNSAYESPLGQWQLSEGVLINTTRDESQSYLQLAAGEGRTAVLQLSDDVDRLGLLSMRVERWSNRGSFEFFVQKSYDGTTWIDVPKTIYSDDIDVRKTLGPVPWMISYELNDSKVTHIKLSCNSEKRVTPGIGGILIGDVTIAPMVGAND